ncbi:MAG: 23S rRNA (pseudouridine(1915)-N(3))-methyltransferase RlmH [Saprospiraceae bacterium]|nr:23S rRNA (pseudouridine(1915)-N(3))-methyltransferase RlmH [Saprospiraceae bacterium]
MKVEFWVIGKTNESYLKQGTELYVKRLSHYLPFQMVVIPDVKTSKGMKPIQLKNKEGEAILQKLKSEDLLILLDERGKSFDSVAFAKYLDQLLMRPGRRLIFLVGGAFGFSEALYQRAQGKLSLSEMTFSHQMIRLFFVEQLYRAMTILRNEPYHNT